MKNILCITDSLNDCKTIMEGNTVYFFPIKQLKPSQHNFAFFKSAFENLMKQVDLSAIDFVFAEYIEALPLVYFIRQAGFYFPALFIPHTNAYPFNILSYFILLKCYAHPADIILCGSENAAWGYKNTLGIEAKNIATFGIKNDFKRLDRNRCRNELLLPKDKKILLFTGRFMNDKGLETLLPLYLSLQKRTEQALQLVISIHHIDPAYYNRLVHYTPNVVIYYRLEREQLVKLYNAADLYVSCALSIFETYGKAPLESIACGTPVILPDWDGFPYYMTPDRGWLGKVDFKDEPFASPYQFARIDEADFADKILNGLNQSHRVKSALPEWAYYDTTLIRIKKLLNELLEHAESRTFFKPSNEKIVSINKSLFSPAVNDFFHYYQIHATEDLLEKYDEINSTKEFCLRKQTILKKLHDEIFMCMRSIKKTIDQIEEKEVFI